METGRFLSSWKEDEGWITNESFQQREKSSSLGMETGRFLSNLKEDDGWIMNESFKQREKISSLGMETGRFLSIWKEDDGWLKSECFKLREKNETFEFINNEKVENVKRCCLLEQSEVQSRKEQYRTVQYCIVQYSTVQYKKVQLLIPQRGKKNIYCGLKSDEMKALISICYYRLNNPNSGLFLDVLKDLYHEWVNIHRGLKRDNMTGMRNKLGGTGDLPPPPPPPSEKSHWKD